MTKRPSTPDNHDVDSFISIPSQVSSNGKVSKKNRRLPDLVISPLLSLTTISQEIRTRHPKATFLSILEWTDAMELAAQTKREVVFALSNKEIEVIRAIYQLKPATKSDLSILQQISESQLLPPKVKYAAQQQLLKYR